MVKFLQTLRTSRDLHIITFRLSNVFHITNCILKVMLCNNISSYVKCFCGTNTVCKFNHGQSSHSSDSLTLSFISCNLSFKT